jgi:hypothetical protein
MIIINHIHRAASGRFYALQKQGKYQRNEVRI